MDLKNVFNKVNDFVNTKKEEYEQYNQRIANSKVFELTTPINVLEDNIVSGNCYEYANMCPYIDESFGKLIDGITPLDETVLSVNYFTQKKDNESYVMVLTNLRIIIMDKEKYHNYNYQEITKFEIITKSIMTQIIDINDIVISLDVSQEELEIIYNLITNNDYRNNYILEKSKYLCGIRPVYQRLNKISSGITIDDNKNVVFHDKKINNYLCKYDDILNYEVLEDNTPVLKRKTNESSHMMTFSKKECMHMTLRVTLNNNQVFEINILEPTTFNSIYSHTDSRYTTEFDFVKAIVDKLDSMNDTLYR